MIKYPHPRNFAHKKTLVKCLHSGCMHPGIWRWLMVITLAEKLDSISLALTGTRLTDFPFPDAGAILLPCTVLRQQLCACREPPIPQKFDLLTPCFPGPSRGDLNHWWRCFPSSAIWINFIGVHAWRRVYNHKWSGLSKWSCVLSYCEKDSPCFPL